VTASSIAHEQIGWLLEDFRSRVSGLTHAVALSADGLVLATTAGLSPARATQLGAITSGLAGISHGAAELFRSGPVLQIVVEMDIGYLLVTRIDDRACVAALAVRDADLEQVGYEVTVLVARVGKVLAPLPRVRPTANGTAPPDAPALAPFPARQPGAGPAVPLGQYPPGGPDEHTPGAGS
jgi:uncharacterized protein